MADDSTATTSAAPAVEKTHQDAAQAAATEAVAPEVAALKTDDDADKAPTPKESTAGTDKTPAEGDVKMADVEKKEDEPPAEPSTEAAAPTETTKPTETSAAKTEAAADEKAAPAESSAANAPAGEEPSILETDATPGDKNKARRKSGAAAPGGKKLNKKASKAKILHLDAKPGDHFFAKLKGFPPWPVIVCDEEILPSNMLNSRPVSAMRMDGTYREDFADGGKRVADRTYPVMYLYTNEFSWTKNTDLEELDHETVGQLVAPKMRKDLQQAHELASQHNSLDFYKEVLRDFQEQLEAKAAKAKAKKEKTHKAKDAVAAEDEDVDMPDADDVEGEGSELKRSKSKKRKAEDDTSTPQRSESVKKPKIKLTTSSTPRVHGANGVQSPKDSSKPVKVKKASKSKEADSKKADSEAPAHHHHHTPELTPEERHTRKQKEILFLRHRLQKGLLNRESEPKEEEMKPMSDFLSKLETFEHLEVSIIRETKIHKVLKAILKLDSIPKETEFNFKPRSQTLLDKWNKILATESTPASATSAHPHHSTNGTTGESSKGRETNGVKHDGEKEPVKQEAQPEPESKGEDKDTPKHETPKVAHADEEKSATETSAAPVEKTAVESTA